MSVIKLPVLVQCEGRPPQIVGYNYYDTIGHRLYSTLDFSWMDL